MSGWARAGAVLRIDLAAVRANWRQLATRVAPQARCAAVVKANAYGLGAAQVASALLAEGCRHFFVAHLDEALAIRPLLPGDASLSVLHGFMPGAEAEGEAAGIVPTLNSLTQIEAWGRLARQLGRRLAANVQVDTGMARLGLSAQDLDVLREAPGGFDPILVQHVMSHLVSAEEPDNPLNGEQLRRLKAQLPMLPKAPVSFANSSGIFLGPEYHFDLARPGAALYGVAPVAGQANPMSPVVTLSARIIQVREIDAGVSVGYNATWTARRPSRIATVAVGYADGFLRSLSQRARGHIGAFEVPLVARVSMDTSTFDVTDVPAEVLARAEGIELLGQQQGVDALAAQARTNGYEILTSLGERYWREYTA
jgi:alanine racemase